jgi:hypothetical protein
MPLTTLHHLLVNMGVTDTWLSHTRKFGKGSRQWYTHTHTHIYIYIYIYKLTHTHTHTQPDRRTHTHANEYTRVYTHTQTRHTFKWAHTRSFTHTLYTRVYLPLTCVWSVRGSLACRMQCSGDSIHDVVAMRCQLSKRQLHADLPLSFSRICTARQGLIRKYDLMVTSLVIMQLF